MRTEPDAATCMYYTGIDPFSKQDVYVARNLRDRKLQRALLQFFKPEGRLAMSHGYDHSKANIFPQPLSY